MAARMETCRSCGTEVPVDPGFSPWCEACGWNVNPLVPARRPGPLDRLYLALGRRLGRGLFEERKRRQARKPRLSLAKVGAYLLASLTYVLTVAFAYGGIVLLASASSIFDFASIFGGALFLVFAWVMRPRMPRLDLPTIGRDEAPALYAFLDRLAASIGAPNVHAVTLVPEFNAWYGTFGWKRQRVVGIGLPLWYALEPQERVAILGHELGHAINGDSARGTFVAGALNALFQLSDVLEPDSLMPSEEGIYSILGLPIRFFQLIVARIVRFVGFSLVVLLYRDGQRAEYYADVIAAKAAGRRAVLAALAQLSAAEGVPRMTWAGQTSTDPVGVIVAKVRGMPDRQRRRIHRAELLEGSRIDFTHPPTPYRIEVIGAMSEAPAAMVLGQSEADAVDQELMRYREPIGRQIIDRFLESVS